MQQMSREITSNESAQLQGALANVFLDSLHVLLEGVSNKKVREASEVAAIICKWVTAHLHTIELLRSIEGPGGPLR